MSAEISWSTERTGALRYGPFFRSAEGRDPYSGCGTVTDKGDHCVIGPLAGELSAQDRDDILGCCAAWGFKKARVERKGRLWEYDLTARPYRRVPV